MTLSNEILSDITIFLKYAKYIPELNRRETWQELVDRNKEMHIKKYPNLSKEIEDAYQFVYDRKVLPSMRSMQFAGKPFDELPDDELMRALDAACDRMKRLETYDQ